MKRQIRRSAFETNSSSNHAILITKNDHLLNEKDAYHNDDRWHDEECMKEYLYINDGTWRITDPDTLHFGRQHLKILSSLKDKVKYAIAYYCGEYSGYTDDQKLSNLKKITMIMQNVFPELEGIELPTREQPIYYDLEGNELDIEEVYTNWEWSEDSPMYHFYKKDGLKHPAIYKNEVYDVPIAGGIDHQSDGLLGDFLKLKNISLSEFLLNKKYVIVITNDECDDWDIFKHSGLIDLDNITEEYNAYKMWEIQRKKNEEGEEG